MHVFKTAIRKLFAGKETDKREKTELPKRTADYLLRVVEEQQETIEKQSRLIADLIAILESWEQTAGYDGAKLKERALSVEQ